MSAVEAHTKQTLGQGIIDGQPLVGAKSGAANQTATGHFTPQLMMSSQSES